MKALNVQKASIEEVVDAFKTRRTMKGIAALATHPRPHADELASIAVLRKYGSKIFPDVAKADLNITTAKWLDSEFGGNEDGLQWARALQKGLLLIGTGNGPFDEHGMESIPSSLYLVAEFLGVDQRPELTDLLTYINYEDSHGEPSNTILNKDSQTPELNHTVKQFNLASMVKKVWRTCKQDEVEIGYKYFVWLLERVIDDLTEAQRAYEEILPHVTYVPIPSIVSRKRGIGTLAVLESNSAHALMAILEKNDQPNLVAILQIEESGQFQIHTVGTRVNLREVVKVIRTEIVFFKNKNLEKDQQIWLDWRTCSNQGTLLEAPEINFYQASRVQRIFNGGLTQPDTDPILGVYFEKEDLVAMILLGLDEDRFATEHRASCEAGECVAVSEKQYCPLYHMGLSRCRTVRRKMHVAEETN